MSFHRLEKMLEGRVPHALLFVGYDLNKIACDFAKKAIGDVQKFPHPDIYQCYPEGKSGMHSASSLKLVIQNASLTPFEAEKKCFIIHDAERMLPTSSNALLKIVEEPPAKTLFLFLTSQREKMLKTLLSRCQTVYFPMKEERRHTPLQQKFVDVLCGMANLEEIVKMLEVEKEGEKQLETKPSFEMTPQQKEAYEKEREGVCALKYQEAFFSLFSTLLDWHRDLFILELGLDAKYLLFPDQVFPFSKKKRPSFSHLRRAIKEAKEGLERNISSHTILETLLMRLGHM